jgi:hypothetical protein
VRVSIVIAAATVAFGLVLLVAALSDLSFERAALLAPVIVVSAGAVIGLGVLWGKALHESWRSRRSRRS